MKMTRAAAIVSGCVALCGCAGPAEFMREPRLSPVGSGLMTGAGEAVGYTPAAGRQYLANAIPTKATDLFTEKRVSQVGDIVTVNIAINDKATLGNSTDRSQEAKTNFTWDFAMSLLSPFSSATSSASSGSPNIANDINSTSKAVGKGTIDRSEKIQLAVAAVVTDVLPNGNLVINGSQEVRVNFELRQLTVAGIARPTDIARNNTVSYDRLAEARISYGGRGRMSEVQQPSWGHQIYDVVRPF